jgi:cyclopropane-fatty-acyl-phospholipid synthase
MTVAEAVAPLVRAAVGREAPVEIRGWDGSRIGPPNAQWAMKINNRRGLRRLLWAPNEPGMAVSAFLHDSCGHLGRARMLCRRAS